MIPIVIGIDLGGTNVRVGAVTLQGELLTAREAPIEAARGPQLGLTRIMDLIDGVQTECGDAPLLG
ncbi:ROK family protein, partial [bacterium]|nr:ROK family protein [bacterium]